MSGAASDALRSRCTRRPSPFLHRPSSQGVTAGRAGGRLRFRLAARFSRKPRARVDEPAKGVADTPLAHAMGGRRRLTAGTLEYEIERARRHKRLLSVLAIVPDEVGFLSAGPGESLSNDEAIESAVRATDIVERIGPLTLPRRTSRNRAGGRTDRRRAHPPPDRRDPAGAAGRSGSRSRSGSRPFRLTALTRSSSKRRPSARSPARRSSAGTGRCSSRSRPTRPAAGA